MQQLSYAEEKARKDAVLKTEWEERKKKEAKAPAVKVVDLDISFGSMVWLMIKAAFAAIPAMIIIGIAWTFLSGILLTIGGR